MQVRNALRAVDERDGAGGVGERDHLADRIDGAEGVRRVSEGNDLRAIGDQLRELLEDHFAGIVHRRDAKQRAFFLAEQLPGDDVRVMLDGGDDDLVAGADVFAAPRLRDEVDALSRAAGEDDFFFVARVNELLHGRARFFVGIRGRFAEVVHAAMNVRVFFGVVADDAIDHLPRLLCRRGVVEIDERTSAANGLREDGEVAADAVDVETGIRLLQYGAHRDSLLRSGMLRGIRANSARPAFSRTTSIFIRSTISLANAYTSRLRASSAPMPRARR